MQGRIHQPGRRVPVVPDKSASKGIVFRFLPYKSPPIDGPTYPAPSGKEVASFSVTVTRKFGDKEETGWFYVECWGALAEGAVKHCLSGREVFVEGRMRFEIWTDKGGFPACRTSSLSATSRSPTGETVKVLW